MSKRFHHCKQDDAEDCGPASLRMIALYYGKDYPMDLLRQRCFITREGVSMQGISEAAESIGLRTAGVCIPFRQLAEEVSLPCILHWNQRHFVVCYKIRTRGRGKASVYIADPASGKVRYKKDEFLKCWLSTTRNGEPHGLALLLEPGPDFGSREDDRRSRHRDMMYFLRYFRPYRRQLWQLLLALLITSVIQMLFPFITQGIVDIGIANRDIGFITVLLIAQLALLSMQMLVGFLRSWMMLQINARVDITLISDFLMKLMRQPLRFFDTKNTGDIMQRIGDHGRIKQFLMGSSLNIVFSMFNFVVFASILGLYHLPILLIFLFGNACYVAWVLLFMHRRRKLDIRRFNLAAAEQSNIVQLIQGMQEIKLNNCEQDKRWEWERIQVKQFKINILSLRLGQIQQLGSLCFSQLTNIIITFIAAKAVLDGSMTLGQMMSLTYIIGQVSAPVGEFIGFAQQLQDARISMERLSEIHRRKGEPDGIAPPATEVPKGSIMLRDVSFSYSGAPRGYALSGITLTIPEGKVTAVVGASGSGKTTLIKLLQGFYQPLKGSITIGEQDLYAVNPHLWRSSTGSVLQDGYIFSDTIARNIAVTGEIDKERLRHASEVACIRDYIASLPLGYSTKIGMEGNGLSQGQRQRILIARAVYKNPDYIFLDEATNALDANNERAILDNLRLFYKGKTVVVAAHRLSTVMDADNVIVLVGGQVREQGTHQELVGRLGLYYKLVRNQLELGNS